MIKQNIIFSEEVLRTRRTHILLSIWTPSHHPFPKVIAVLLVSPDEWRTSRNLQVNSPAVKRPPSEEQLVRWDCLPLCWPLSLHACWPLNERQCLLLQNVKNGLASSTKKKKKKYIMSYFYYLKKVGHFCFLPQMKLIAMGKVSHPETSLLGMKAQSDVKCLLRVPGIPV